MRPNPVRHHERNQRNKKVYATKTQSQSLLCETLQNYWLAATCRLKIRWNSGEKAIVRNGCQKTARTPLRPTRNATETRTLKQIHRSLQPNLPNRQQIPPRPKRLPFRSQSPHQQVDPFPAPSRPITRTATNSSLDREKTQYAVRGDGEGD
jgi:hypothetical protein